MVSLGIPRCFSLQTALWAEHVIHRLHSAYLCHYKHRYGSSGELGVSSDLSVFPFKVSPYSEQVCGQVHAHIHISRLHHILPVNVKADELHASEPQRNVLAVVNLIPPPRVTQVGLCQRCLLFYR